MKQLSLLQAPPLFHGGELALGKRKSRRPFDPKRSLHLTLKAERPVLFARRVEIEKEIRRWAARFHVKLYELAVNFDHIHVLLFAPSKRLLNAFHRALSSRLAALLGKGIWALLPFSRVVSWGRAFRVAREYIRRNREEAEGKRPYEKRKDWYRRHKKKARKDGKP